MGDGFTLRNILAYRRDVSHAPIDFDSLPAADVDVPAIYRNRQFSNEFQVLYEGSRLQGVAGLYYLDANANNIFDVVLATTTRSGYRGSPPRPSATSTPRPGLPSPTSPTTSPISSRSRSAAATPTIVGAPR